MYFTKEKLPCPHMNVISGLLFCQIDRADRDYLIDLTTFFFHCTLKTNLFSEKSCEKCLPCFNHGGKDMPCQIKYNSVNVF